MHAPLRLGANPAATYRTIDAVGRTAAADPHQLIELMYKECIAALRAAAFATEKKQATVKSERIARATAILFALESNLDFERGGEVSRTLATLYHGLRTQIVQASIGGDPTPFRAVADDLEEIAGAWSQARAA
ncbi:flagellar export chaperone FliS [Sphingomonas turrisvirgatae]|uniref:Flagellar secretion chaperone FliS n=1 Tax=Sphingomonas turrisvirgatae TaxID=1888892 RepID=A0A1E3LV28_9SPHN|nr:flagellar export chaperone FliS [Sphingomonas turrisvirgatae]ODP37637.1 flagellar export chaperone FliS [Sphingomonas turrisvirgatae]